MLGLKFQLNPKIKFIEVLKGKLFQIVIIIIVKSQLNYK